MFRTIIIHFACYNLLACFHNNLFVTADTLPPFHFTLHAPSHSSASSIPSLFPTPLDATTSDEFTPALSLDTDVICRPVAPVSALRFPRSFADFPDCSDVARSERYKSLCTFWYTASPPTPQNPDTLTICVYGPNCEGLIQPLGGLPFGSKIEHKLDTSLSRILGVMYLTVSYDATTSDWQARLRYAGQDINFHLPLDANGNPYSPADFQGKVVRWTAFNCYLK